MIKKNKSSSLPQSKEELLEKICTAYEQLNAELTDLKEEHHATPELEGTVSICNLLAYQIGWGKLLLGWEAAEKKGEKPIMPAEGYKWNQLGKLAQSFYHTYQNYTFRQLLEEFEIVKNHIIEMIHSMHNEELYMVKQRQWTGEKWPIVKWIQVNTIAPYSSARKKIRKWKKNNFLAKGRT